MTQSNRYTSISLFTGAMGLDLGLECAGFDTRVAVECNVDAIATLRANRPALPVIARKLETVRTSEILRMAGLGKGEATLVTGGPSCQPFSTAGRRGSIGDPRGTMFHEFCRVVREARPRFFVMENVTGVLSAAVRHRALAERGAGYPKLMDDEQLGSALLLVLGELKSLGYFTTFSVLNAADYGVPQHRERVIFVGSRDNEPFAVPTPTHAAEPMDGLTRWQTLRNAVSGLNDVNPVYREFSPAKKKYLRLVPEGGNWHDLPARHQTKAMGKALNSWGGRVGFWRRLSWDRPSPALPTVPDGRATMLCHPTELRPLSVREYARIQQFPDDWTFSGSVASQYRQIGNALPLGLGEAIGRALVTTARCRRRVRGRGVLACANEGLLRRLANGHKTRLNPPRMRRVKDLDRTRKWTGTIARKKRKEILDLVIPACDVRFRANSRPKGMLRKEPSRTTRAHSTSEDTTHNCLAAS